MPAHITLLHDQPDWQSQVSHKSTSLPEPWCRLSRGPSSPPPSSSPGLQTLCSAFPHCLLLAVPSAPQTAQVPSKSCRLFSKQDEDKVAGLVGEPEMLCIHSPSGVVLSQAHSDPEFPSLPFHKGCPPSYQRRGTGWYHTFLQHSQSCEFVCEGHCTLFTGLFVLQSISQLRKEEKYSCHEFCLQRLFHFLVVEFISGALAPSCSPRMKRSVVLVGSN